MGPCIYLLLLINIYIDIYVDIYVIWWQSCLASILKPLADRSSPRGCSRALAPSPQPWNLGPQAIYIFIYTLWAPSMLNYSKDKHNNFMYDHKLKGLSEPALTPGSANAGFEYAEPGEGKGRGGDTRPRVATDWSMVNIWYCDQVSQLVY